MGDTTESGSSEINGAEIGVGMDGTGTGAETIARTGTRTSIETSAGTGAETDAGTMDDNRSRVWKVR